MTHTAHLFRVCGGAVRQLPGRLRSGNMSEKLRGNILVTGANRGIGLELVRQLAQSIGENAHIYACCREIEGPRAQALKNLSTPGKITLVKLDLSDEGSISSAVQAVSRNMEAGGLNLLINNAAINRPESPAPLSATGKQHMMDVYETNVVGPFLLVKMLLPLLQKAAEMDSEGDQMSCSRSAIVNISTLISSIEKCPESFHIAQMYPYRTSKAALNMLTRCHAEEFKRHNILVTAVHPGWVRTEMGGEKAPLTPEDSVAGMLSVMLSLSNKHSGMLLDWQGNTIPW